MTSSAYDERRGDNARLRKLGDAKRGFTRRVRSSVLATQLGDLALHRFRGRFARAPMRLSRGGRCLVLRSRYRFRFSTWAGWGRAPVFGDELARGGLSSVFQRMSCGVSPVFDDVRSGVVR